MKNETMSTIGQSLFGFQAALKQAGSNLAEYLETYLKEPEKVKSILAQDMERGMDLFERLVVHAMTRIVEKNEEDLKALGVAAQVPERPFRRFKCDEAKRKFGIGYEIKLGR